MELIVVSVMATLLFGMFTGVLVLVLFSRHSIRRAELEVEAKALEVRRLEAQAAADASHPQIPSYIETSDPEAAANYAKAQQELDALR